MFVGQDELERDKQLLDLCTSVLEAEEERLKGKPTMSISEARKALDREGIRLTFFLYRIGKRKK